MSGSILAASKLTLLVDADFLIDLENRPKLGNSKPCHISKLPADIWGATALVSATYFVWYRSQIFTRNG